MINQKTPAWIRLQWVGRLGILLGLLTACQKSEPVVETTSSPSPSIGLPSATASPSVTPSASPTPYRQTYREKSGLFQISWPKGYNHTVTKSGVAFVSGDQGFAGSVDFGLAEGKQLNTQQLEASLKTEFANRLQEVNWQTSQVQPDGSLRIDWTGKDKSGDALDAVSIIEQRGNYIFVLNLFGINKPYQNYNSDAEMVVASYQIQPAASPQASASPKTEAESSGQ